MITDKKLAKEVSAHLLDVYQILNQSIASVDASANKQEADKYKQAIARILGELLLEVVNPLYQQHPDLKPNGLFVPEGK